MAYSVVFSGASTPFESRPCEKAIFSYSEHVVEDIWRRYTFFNKANGESGYLFYTCTGDYTELYILARVLIDAQHKHVYVSDVIVESKDDLANSHYFGSFRAFKRFDHQFIMTEMLRKFFGADWRFSLRFAHRHRKSCIKQHRKRVACLDALVPPLATNLIARWSVPWSQETPLSKKDITWFYGQEEDYIGVPGHFYTEYAEGKVIAVYGM